MVCRSARARGACFDAVRGADDVAPAVFDAAAAEPGIGARRTGRERGGGRERDQCRGNDAMHSSCSSPRMHTETAPAVHAYFLLTELRSANFEPDAKREPTRNLPERASRLPLLA